MSLNSAVAGLSPPSTCSNDDNRGYDQTWNYDGWDEIFQVRIAVRIALDAPQEAREICHKQSPFRFTVPRDLEPLRTAPPSSAANALAAEFGGQAAKIPSFPPSTAHRCRHDQDTHYVSEVTEPSRIAPASRLQALLIWHSGPGKDLTPRHRIQAVGGAFRADDRYGQRDSAAGDEFMARRRSQLRGSALPARQRRCRLMPPSTGSIRNSERRLQGRLDISTPNWVSGRRARFVRPRRPCHPSPRVVAPDRHAGPRRQASRQGRAD